MAHRLNKRGQGSEDKGKHSKVIGSPSAPEMQAQPRLSYLLTVNKVKYGCSSFLQDTAIEFPEFMFSQCSMKYFDIWTSRGHERNTNDAVEGPKGTELSS